MVVTALAWVGVTLSLYLVGCRALRCFALASMSSPVLIETKEANVTAVLLLAAALTWRFRRSGFVATGAVIKPLIAPLLAWCALQDRRGTLKAVLTGVSIALISWAAIRFQSLTRYPTVLSGDSQAAGVTFSMGRAGIGLAALLLAIAGRLRNNEVASYSLVLAACIAVSPIVWIHYFMFAFLPLAITRPRLSWRWFVSLAYWVIPHGDGSRAWAHEVGLAITAILFVTPLLGSRPRLVALPSTGRA